MTTIVWDGKELVADMQVTTTITALGKRERIEKTFNTIKIGTSDNLFFGEQPVLAYGVAGDARMIGVLKNQCRYKLRIDLASSEPYEFAMAAFSAFTLLLVLHDKIVIVNTKNRILSFNEYDKAKHCGIGSGAIMFRELIASAVSTARNIVRMAGCIDAGTGGNMVVWTEQDGLNVGVESLKFTNIAKRSIANFFGF